MADKFYVLQEYFNPKRAVYNTQEEAEEAAKNILMSNPSTPVLVVKKVAQYSATVTVSADSDSDSDSTDSDSADSNSDSDSADSADSGTNDSNSDS